jgi:hypothetical protein
MGKRLKAPSPALVIALIALFLSIGGISYAASKIGTKDIKKAAVTTSKIHKQAVTTGKLADGAVNGQKVLDDSLTGADIDESTLGQVPDAAKLNGNGPAAFLSSNVIRRESAVAAGTPLGDGTFYIDEPCPAGDQLLNGGPANVAGTSVMVESFPTPGGTNSWRARIKPAAADNFSVVVLCAAP